MFNRPQQCRARLAPGLCLLFWLALLGTVSLTHARLHTRPLHNRHGAHHASISDETPDTSDAASPPDHDKSAAELSQGAAVETRQGAAVEDEWSNAPDFGDPSAPRDGGTPTDTADTEDASDGDPGETEEKPEPTGAGAGVDESPCHVRMKCQSMRKMK